MRRTLLRIQLHKGGVGIDTPSPFTSPRGSPLIEVAHSPYKEAFKEHWSRPLQYLPRDFGRKPEPGEPVPCREAATMLICSRNKYSKTKEDYKVLMVFREAKGRYVKDNFVFPGSPLALADREQDDWKDAIRITAGKDKPYEIPTLLPYRVAAMRALVTECNMLVTPDGIGEIQGPAGLRKWQALISSTPSMLINLNEVLGMPLTQTFDRLQPFVRIQSPINETHRFDNMYFVCPFHTMADLRYITPTVGETLVWVSPQECIERHGLGLMEMPTAAFIIMTMLAEYPKLDDVIALTRLMKGAKDEDDVPVIVPEVHIKPDNMSIITLPGDELHSSNKDEKTRAAPGTLRRLEYFKDYPYGTRFEWRCTNSPVAIPERPAEKRRDDELRQIAYEQAHTPRRPFKTTPEEAEQVLVQQGLSENSKKFLDHVGMPIEDESLQNAVRQDEMPGMPGYQDYALVEMRKQKALAQENAKRMPLPTPSPESDKKSEK